jgi:hypothetical protein
LSNFYDDQSLPAKGFSGDESDDIFGDPDVVNSSPTTSERIVDTQSGYLVVVKKDGSRAALSVKRRVGTPPSSFVMLTPDEQIKLAKILAEAKVNASRVSPKTEQWNNSLSRKTRAAEEEQQLKFDSAPEKEFERVRVQRAEEYEQMRSERARKTSFTGGQVVSGLVGLVLVSLAGYYVFTHFVGGAKTAASSGPAPQADTQITKETKVDKFVREFVADMLDFAPTTYRSSQVHAMSVMTPELLDKYWQETNFPLSKAQLNATPKGQTLIITKVLQTPGADDTTNVDLYAELASPNSKVSAPVHLQLEIGEGTDEQLKVIAQKDLSSSAAAK